MDHVSKALVQRVEEIAQRYRERQQRDRQRKEQQARATPVKSAKVVPLPLWPEPVRACPSCVLRSALFGVVQRGRRKALKRQVLAAWPGTTIRYTGFRLDQADLDVWMLALHLSRAQGLGAQVACSERGFLRALDRATKNVEWLRDSLTRLSACAVEITHQEKTYWGPLVEKGCRDEQTGEFVILLNPELAALFDDLTWQEWEVRRSLTTDLAKWLQGYIESHQATAQKPHRIGLNRLQELCGSEASRLRKFREHIRKAMAELQTTKVVASWRITEGDALEFARPSKRRRLNSAP